MSAKTWTLTINNWMPDEWIAFEAFAREFCKKAVCGREIGEEGTPHMQGAFTCTQNRSLKWLKEKFPRAHLEKARAPFEASLEYCTKEDPAAFVMNNSKQGERNDLEEVYKLLKAGTTMSGVMDTEPSYQAICVAEKWMKYKGVKRPHGAREVLWFWGATGSGKSRKAYEIDPDLHMIQCTGAKERVWFDGYTDQKTILLDDLRPHQIDFAKLLRLCDRYTVQEQTKGGFLWGNYDRVIITSALPPTLWTTDGTDIGQLIRRITVTETFSVSEVP